MKTYPLRVKRKFTEGEDACTFILAPEKENEALFKSYRVAQFLTFHLNIGGKTLTRSYSLSSSPLLREDLTTTVKRVQKGQGSSFLIDHIKENDLILSSRPQGKFFKPPNDLKARHYFIVGAGSGITPLFSIIKTVLLSDEENEVTLVYCNRKKNSIIYREEIEKWEKQYSKRFRVIHVLSQPEPEDSFHHKGRLNESVLKEILSQNQNLKTTEYYLCGPIEMMKMATQIFLENGAEKSHIHKESFGSTHLTPQALKAPATALVVSASENTNEDQPLENITAHLDGETLTVSAQPDISILEQLIDSGYAPPFSCMEGNCMTCMAVLKKGKIYQEDAGILEEENISAKEILTCQAKPLSSVEVNYD